MYLGTTPELEKALVPVRIPVDKNLGGYMVFLIRKEDAGRFAAVKTVEDLKKFKIGQGLGWLDVDILRANGFNVVTGSNYDGLFDMLANGRFDAFSRAAVEILDEYRERHEKIPDLAIEQTFILYYPLPMYFWFSKNDDGERLAARAREGMMGMIEDGTYDRIFLKYQKWKIDALHLRERKIFRISNPLLGPETPFSDKRLWYDPTGKS
jgi:ABC-type amino acid transport substrate-binding protein